MMSKANSKAKPATQRMDVVFIRVSTQQQDDEGQIANVRLVLDNLKVKVSVPEENWFAGTVSRRKVKTNG